MSPTLRNDQIKAYVDAANTLQLRIMLLDKDGNILAGNHRLTGELGYVQEQTSPKTVFQVNPHFNFIAWKEIWEQLEKNGHIILNTEHLSLEGQILPVRLYGIMLDNLVCQMLVFQQDDEKGQEELQVIRSSFDYIQQGAVIISQDGTLLHTNFSFQHSLGYTGEELSKLKLRELQYPAQAFKWDEFWKELKDQKRIQKEVYWQTKTGNVVEMVHAFLHLDFNKKDYALLLTTDFPKNKQVEESTRLLVETLDQLPDMVFWLNEDATFRNFNNALIEISGYSREELNQMTLLKLFPEHTLEDFKRGWELLKTGKVLSSEREMTCKDGTKVLTDSIVKMVNVEGVYFSSTVLRDVRERKKQQDALKLQLKENERLRRQAQDENIILKEEIEFQQGSTNIISKSPRYKKVLRQVSQVADTDATVLITGETGTGKELLAQAIHSLSNRANKPMVKVNCGALPENLIESELFGHEKGAFTGAYQRKQGRFEMAHRGTLFLDEIGELPLELQAKLLRVLQEGEFERLGGTETHKVDVRLITATNRNLEEMVEKGKFREDLFYRINVFPIYNLPLRERKEDIPPLIRHFIEKYNNKLGRQITEVPQSVIDDLTGYDYPGNVRELENLIERAVILSTGKKLEGNFNFRQTKPR